MNGEAEPFDRPEQPEEAAAPAGEEVAAQADGTGAAESGKDKEKDEKKEGSWVRENIEAIIVAIVLALIIRQFAMEAFVIPTGSMAPTLYGQHVSVSCPNCGREFAVDNPDKSGRHEGFDKAFKRIAECPRCKSKRVVYLYEGEYSDNTEALCQECSHRWIVRNPTSGRTVLAKRLSLMCPNCECEFQKDITPSDITGGHKILVNKAGMLVRSPKRWDVIVFKFPEEPTKNYIKRLIGLPGESILIDNGDIYANGKVARKELDVIHAMSFEVFSSELVQKWEKLVPWTSFGGKWQCSVESLEVEARKGEAYVEFAKPRGITSALPYSNPGSDTPVSDVGYRLRTTCESEGEFFCSIDDGEHAFRFRLPVGNSGKASLTMDDIEVKSADLQLIPGKSYEVEFLNIDNRVLALLDGREVFRYDYESELTVSASVEILLGTVDTAARFDKIHVYRDIYYTCPHDAQYAVRSPAELGPDEYFALGDNSASSKDSRRWGTIPAPNMLGRAFVIFWPIPEIRFIK
jgi:signal peptidase I